MKIAGRSEEIRKSAKNCILSLQAKTAQFPDTLRSALFAYHPESLSEDEAVRLAALYQTSTPYQRMIDNMRRDRRFLAPQYGL